MCRVAGAAPYNSFRRVTNPHMFDLGGVLILGTSGQNVDDMAKYTRGQDRCVPSMRPCTCISSDSYYNTAAKTGYLLELSHLPQM